MNIQEFMAEYQRSMALVTKPLVRIRVTEDAIPQSAAIMPIDDSGADVDPRMEFVMHPDDWKAAKRVIPLVRYPAKVNAPFDQGYRFMGLPVVIDE